jgi:tetratricopeptide (TPR) repeat protein
MKFTAADIHCLNAAEGWLELGNHLEAGQELDNITPEFRAHPIVLQMRWRVYSQAKKWDLCVEIASAWTRLNPEDEQAVVNLGNSLYFDGRTQEAFDCVSGVMKRFPENAILRYNLACYACQLGMMDVAKMWFGEAFELDDKKELKLMALEDPDLKPMWETLQTE